MPWGMCGSAASLSRRQPSRRRPRRPAQPIAARTRAASASSRASSCTRRPASPSQGTGRSSRSWSPCGRATAITSCSTTPQRTTKVPASTSTSAAPRASRSVCSFRTRSAWLWATVGNSTKRSRSTSKRFSWMPPLRSSTVWRPSSSAWPTAAHSLRASMVRAGLAERSVSLLMAPSLMSTSRSVKACDCVAGRRYGRRLMKVKLRNPDQLREVPGPAPVFRVLEQLGINPETVLVIHESTLVTKDHVLPDDAEVEVRPVISGGAGPAKCHRCGARAVMEVARHRAAYCGEHFVEHVRTQVREAISRYGMLSYDDRVLVAVSGGKDSLALWDVLLDMGYRADGLYLGRGIGTYSSRSEALVQQFAARRRGSPCRAARP